MLTAALGLILLLLVLITRDVDAIRKDASRMRTLLTCPTCHGSGYEESLSGISEKCLTCQGTGLKR
jgi:hypothetical protein